MADFLSRIDRYLDVLEKIDYARLAKNGLVVFSLAIIHYFGFIYFAFGYVPPFVDIKSFANLTFNAAAMLAVSGLVGRALTMVFTRVVVPVAASRQFSKRRDKHKALRLRRRKEKDNGPRGENALLSDQNLRNFHRITKLTGPMVIQAGLKFELPMMVPATLLCFFIFYLGWQIALVCFGIIATVALLLFVPYIFVSLVHDWAKAETRQEIIQALEAEDGEAIVRDSVYEARIWLSFIRYFLSGSIVRFLNSGVVKGFMITSVGLLLGATALIVGASRAAHSLDASTYTIELLQSEDRLDPLRVKIALVTSTGIMGLNLDGDEPTFIPFNGVVSVGRPLTEPADSGFYRDRLMGYLPFYD